MDRGSDGRWGDGVLLRLRRALSGRTAPSRDVDDHDAIDSSDVETLRLARAESRAVLDHQIALLDDIDDRALGTVRTAVVILVLLVSAGQIAGPSRLGSLHWTVSVSVAVAGVLLAFSIVVGTAIYAVTRVPFGIGPLHRTEAVSEAYTEREWLSLLLGEYDRWTTEALELTENNARWLTYVQGSFVFGTCVLFATASVTLVPGAAAVIATGVLLLAIALLAVRHVGSGGDP